MQLPYRKPGKFSTPSSDPYLTQKKFDELTQKLERLKKITQPHAAREVARLAEFGDFSENAEYQLAKGKLRSINSTILLLEHRLNQAEVIPKHRTAQTIRVGHTVTLTIDGVVKKYQILGSTETKPEGGIISHASPLGTALMGRSIGDKFTLHIANKDTLCEIIAIEY